MAPAKKETSVELCRRVNAQGNTIAIRMLEYLSTAKSPIPGFESLATEFIELCQVLWSIEAGLTEAAKSRNGLPVEVAQELDRRIRQINEEFSVLSQMVNKCMLLISVNSLFTVVTDTTTYSRRQREPQRRFRHEVSHDVC
jgi:hypothetical protein